jgi:hypothetical protein
MWILYHEILNECLTETTLKYIINLLFYDIIFMTYSIQHNKRKLFKHAEPTPTFIEWQSSFSLNNLFEKYENIYVINNDVKIYGTSYFSILNDLFYDCGFSFEKFQQRLLNIHSIIYDKVYHNRYAFYEEIEISKLEKTITVANNSCDSYDSHLDFEDVNEYDSFNIDKNYTEIKLNATNDADNLEPYLLEITQKNYIVMEEFKSFVAGFFEYVQSKDPKEFGFFLETYNLLFNDMQFFKSSKVQSLDKYVFTIGSHTKKHYESRGRDSSFVPAGYCSYGNQIFINSEPTDNKKYGKLWADRALKHTFYHEIAHALDRLYYDDIVLRNGVKKPNSSYNEELMQCCKLSYKNLKRYSPQLRKKTINWLSYFCAPEIKKINKSIVSTKLSNNSVQTLLIEQLQKDSSILFANKLNNNKIFSTKLKKDNFEYNYSRALEETWSESFAFIFNWIKNPFCEYDRYILKAGKSQERTYIKINYKALIYILDNFDWSKLNIPYSVFLRKKVQIKKLLNYVNEMPLVLNHTRIREFKHKKYLKFNDILKSK